MRARHAAILSTLAMVMLAGPVSAQDDGTGSPATIISNAAFCSFVSQDVASCEAALSGLAGARIVPEAWAALVDGQPSTGFPFPFPFPGPIIEAPVVGEVGDVLARDDSRIRLVRVNWNPSLSDSPVVPAEGNKYVSALVRYRATQDGASYSIIGWGAMDDAGTRYGATVVGPKAPALLIGQLAAGTSAKGWVTFEVPEAVDKLRVIESQAGKPDLAWSVQR